MDLCLLPSRSRKKRARRPIPSGKLQNASHHPVVLVYLHGLPVAGLGRHRAKVGLEEVHGPVQETLLTVCEEERNRKLELWAIRCAGRKYRGAALVSFLHENETEFPLTTIPALSLLGLLLLLGATCCLCCCCCCCCCCCSARKSCRFLSLLLISAASGAVELFRFCLWLGAIVSVTLWLVLCPCYAIALPKRKSDTDDDEEEEATEGSCCFAAKKHPCQEKTHLA